MSIEAGRLALDKTRLAPQLLGQQVPSSQVPKGESLCIVGPSGCGKSSHGLSFPDLSALSSGRLGGAPVDTRSLLRVIGGLWGIEEGTVVRA